MVESGSFAGTGGVLEASWSCCWLGIAVFLVGVRRVAVPLVVFSSLVTRCLAIRLHEGLAGELPSRSAYPDISGSCGMPVYFLHAVQDGYLPLYRHISNMDCGRLMEGQMVERIGQERADQADWCVKSARVE
jgi:hypothetical protein